MSHPLVGVSACLKTPDGRRWHSVGEKYLTPIADCAGATPLILPALGEALELAAVVGRLDGLVLTGSPSNVHPRHYGAAPAEAFEPYDESRDATTLPLIRQAIAAGLPLLAICRGFQELNVALGGSLHPALHELAGRDDHRRPKSDDIDVQYGPKHVVALLPGGAFARLAGAEEIEVNSLHRQGIDRLAPGLVAEATAPDGTIEGVSVRDSPAFALGVQWHPEHRAAENAFSVQLYRAFGEAARARAAGR